MQKGYFLPIAFTLLLSSCGPLENHLVQREYLSINSPSSPRDTITYRAGSVEIFKAGEPLPFAYERLGVVKAMGRGNESAAQLYNHLLYETYRQGGNAVIGVKDTLSTRDFGEEGSYSVPTVTGIAVNAYKDRQYRSMYPIDSSRFFIEVVKNDSIEAHNTRDERAFGQVMSGTLLTGIMVLGIIYGEEEEEE